MGLARAAVRLLIEEAAARPFHGVVLTLGRQHVYVTAAEVTAMAQQYQVGLVLVPPELHREPSLARKGYVSDDWLLKSLGFSEIVRIDYSDYETVDQLLDLNDPNTPSNLSQRFDVVMDTGTVEHVFDIASALRHCVRMVRRGGRIIHLSPSSNCVEHGFYSVSPTLYSDFYTASGFCLNRIRLCETPLDMPRGVWNVYDYGGSAERFISLGQLSGKTWFTMAIVTASETSEPKNPQQWIYTQTWSDAEAATDSDGPLSQTTFEVGSRSQRLVNQLACVPPVQRVVVMLIQKWRKAIHAWRVRRKRLPYPFVGKF